MAESYRRFQIGYVVREIDGALAEFERLGACRLDRIIDMRDDRGAPSMILNLAHLMMRGVEIELIEPRAGYDSVYSGCLADGQSTVLHHLGFMADDDAAWDAGLAELVATGAAVAMAIDLPRVRVRYFDTRNRLGHFFELVQRRRHQPLTRASTLPFYRFPQSDEARCSVRNLCAR